MSTTAQIEILERDLNYTVDVLEWENNSRVITSHKLSVAEKEFDRVVRPDRLVELTKVDRITFKYEGVLWTGTFETLIKSQEPKL